MQALRNSPPANLVRGWGNGKILRNFGLGRSLTKNTNSSHYKFSHFIYESYLKSRLNFNKIRKSSSLAFVIQFIDFIPYFKMFFILFNFFRFFFFFFLNTKCSLFQIYIAINTKLEQLFIFLVSRILEPMCQQFCSDNVIFQQGPNCLSMALPS